MNNNIKTNETKTVEYRALRTRYTFIVFENQIKTTKNDNQKLIRVYFKNLKQAVLIYVDNVAIEKRKDGLYDITLLGNFDYNWTVAFENTTQLTFGKSNMLDIVNTIEILNKQNGTTKITK